MLGGKYIGYANGKPFLAVRINLPNHIQSVAAWKNGAASKLLLITDKGTFWAPRGLRLAATVDFTVIDMLIVDYTNLEKSRVPGFKSPLHVVAGKTVDFNPMRSA